jgi:hypothetical protein
VNRILIFLIIFPFWLQGQTDVAASHFDTENGLVSNTIYSIQQDKFGHLLIGHEKGVSVFNGIAFQSPTIPGGFTALSNLVAFDSNRFICRNFSGKSYVFQGDSIHEIKTPTTSAGGYPTFLSDDEKVYAFHGELFYELLKNGKIKRFRLNGFPGFYRFRLAHVTHDFLYAVIVLESKIRFITYDLKNERITHSKDFEHEQAYDVYGEPNNYILVHRINRSFERINPNKLETKKLLPPGINLHSKITFIEQNSKGNYLVGTFNGLLIYDQNFKLIDHLLKGLQVSTYLEDKEHNHWVGTLQNGLYRIPSFYIHQFKVQEIPGRNVKLSKALLLENGNLILGTYDGRVILLNQQGGIEKIIDLHKTAEIQSLYQVDNQKVLVYCEQLLTIDLKLGKVTSSYPITATKCIDNLGDQWVFGTSKGIHFKGSAEQQILDSLWVKQIHFLSSESLLLGTSKGLKLYQISSQTLQNIYPFGSVLARDLVKLKGRFYFRIENTIYAYIGPNQFEKIKSYSEEIQRLYSDGIGLLVHTKNNTILSLLHPQTIRINASKGLIQKEIESIFNRNGNLILFNQNGLQWFSNLLPKNLIQPNIHISRIQGSFSMSDNLWTSSFSNNRFELEIELLPNLSAQGKGLVQYQISGLQKEWTNIYPNQNAYYLKLDRIPAGTRELRIRGLNEDGVYSQTKTFTLIVSAPYYLSFWFLVCVILLLSLLIFIILRIKTNYLTRKNEVKLEKERLKMKAIKAELAAIRSQMNPHFIFNSLSSIQSQILNESPLEAYQNLSIFAKLMRKALHYSSKEFINLKEELEFIDHYVALELLRINQGFNYHKNVDSNLKLEQIYLPSLLLQPFVENAIRHGIQHLQGEKTLSITVSQIQQGVEITITDNGIGRKKSGELNAKNRTDHESFATQAINDRIEMLSKVQNIKVSIDIIDLEQGTSVVIQIINSSND